MSTELEQESPRASPLQAMKGRKCVVGLVSLLICTSLVVAATAPGARQKKLENHHHLDAEAILGGDGSGTTKMFVIESEEAAKRMAGLHATDNKELMFTTYSFTHNQHYSYDAIFQALHIWENLRKIGRLNNSIIITYDVHSCQVLWEYGIPCFLDRYLPQPAELPGQYGTDVPHWYQKYAWALKFLEWGYRVTFFETDMFFLEDPFPYRNTTYDLEGLSDWHKAELPVAKDRFTSPCAVYHMQKGNSGENFLEWGANDPGNVRSQTHVNPCVSTGFWFAEPTQPTKEFLEAFIDLMLHWRSWQTDQRLWNEMIMAFLIGQTGHRQLRFSLLDDTKFSNFEVVRWRKEQKLAIEPVMMHAGALSGSQKEPYMREHGYWLAGDWDRFGAMDHIRFLLQSFNRTLPTFNRAHLGD